jgi:PDZ domain-containing protein
MFPRRRLDTAGFALLAAYVLAVELLWLFDPIRPDRSVYLIDLFNPFFRTSALAPLLWGLSAVFKLRNLRIRQNPEEGRPVFFSARLWLIVLRVWTAAVAFAAAAFIVAAPDQWAPIVTLLLVAAASVLAEWAASEWAHRRSFPRTTAAAAAVVIAVAALLLFPTNRSVIYPGLTVNMNRYAQVEGAVSGERGGGIMGVLVFERPAFPVDWLFARLFPHYEFYARDPDVSVGEQLREVRGMKVDANTIGSAVAFEKAGLGVQIRYRGANVVATDARGPASAALEPGDLIVEVDGLPITAAGDLVRHMAGLQPGDEVTLEVRRQGKPMTVTLQAAEHPDRAGAAYLGVSLMDDVQIELPQSVHYREYLIHAGGPSHGAMLALALLDQLTPGGVTYGNRAAGTGTIDLNGNIGPIGGIAQKTYAVERAGADVFFVPASQAEEARRAASKLRIVPVETLDDMLNWLKEHPKHD